ncbi:hypothetical protein RIF25_08780 [Thermosynechococcaceae cyanobacterium BACA0444]|uniref:Uncharacterized protein n=1 Tax=Pseudocalidococcus azoricus BACA0444 TaxID=2918990 RepID=A0AAE4JZJ5_9CYAN|nr:hypothetical protein [Pseudocalidococcus azoricus]MDS3860907.1 hypothetical protein [Pseudocalidococcus azoricus BACA0444]
MLNNELWTLRVPFQMIPGKGIDGLDQPFEEKIGNLTIKLRYAQQFYVFEVEGLESEQADKEYLNKICIGLRWVMLNSDLAFDIHTDFNEVIYNPTHNSDGLVNINYPTVYPSSNKIYTVTAGNAVATLLTDVNYFHSLLIEGLDKNSFDITSNKKLNTAFELYNLHYYEHSENARFLILVMVLEVLKTSCPKQQVVQTLIDRWIQ